MAGEKDYLSLPLSEFLADTAAKTPTPGGGCTASLVGALAVSQARMVIEYTLGKEQFAQYEEHLQAVLDKFKKTQDEFQRLMGEDIAAYERFCLARKSKEPDAMERALATAIAVPMENVVLAGEIMTHLDEIKTMVNPQLLSDFRIAAILAYACARAGCTTARVNIDGMSDRKEAGRLEDQLDLIVARTGRHRNSVVCYQPL